MSFQHKFWVTTFRNSPIIDVRKKYGSDYEPKSLRGLLSIIQRYLNKQDYSVTLFYWCVFKTAMAILKAKQKELKAKGLGNKPRTSDSERDKCLGFWSPQDINTLCLNWTFHFGLHGSNLTDQSDAGELWNPSKHPTEKSICCMTRILYFKRKIKQSLKYAKFLCSC